MARKLHTPHSEFPYHVTARSHDGIWFRLPPDVLWGIFSDYLYFLDFAYGVKIHSFVMMSNHFHLLVTTPQGNLSQAMNYFMRETSREINRLSGHTNQVYGNRYYRTLITNNFHFDHVYKYIYRNPVSARITERCELYPYSTLHGLLGFSRLSVPVIEDVFLFKTGVEQTLTWLNTAPRLADYHALKRALKFREIRFPKTCITSGGHNLDRHPF